MKKKNKFAWWGVPLSVLLLSACQPATQSATEVIDPESVGGKVLVEFCSDCHAPPNPANHVAAEWPNVVYRMQERRRMKGYSLMADDDIDALVAYLQQHARS